MKTCEIKEAFGIDALKFAERPRSRAGSMCQIRIRVRRYSSFHRREEHYPYDFGKIVTTRDTV